MTFTARPVRGDFRSGRPAHVDRALREYLILEQRGDARRPVGRVWARSYRHALGAWRREQDYLIAAAAAILGQL